MTAAKAHVEASQKHNGKGHITVWAIYAHFSKDQNSGFKLLVLFFNNEGYRRVSNEEINVKIFK